VGNDRNIANWGAFAVAAHDVLGWEGGKFETRAGAEDRRAYVVFVAPGYGSEK
jgi:hypothetical protein